MRSSGELPAVSHDQSRRNELDKDPKNAPGSSKDKASRSNNGFHDTAGHKSAKSIMHGVLVECVRLFDIGLGRHDKAEV